MVHGNNKQIASANKKNESNHQDMAVSPGPEDENAGEKNITRVKKPVLSPEQKKVYQQAIKILNKSGVEYAIGAAFARYAYTRVWRHTKDLDVYVRPQDLKATLDAFKEAEFGTEIRDRHWLAKTWKGEHFIDLLFGTGHGQLPVNDESFSGTVQAEVLGVPTYLIPIEEVIASDAYIVGRNRFDGGEIVHLIRSSEGNIDWNRIVDRLGENRQLLLWHLLLFDFIYPGHSDYLPQDLMAKLFKEVRKRWKDNHTDPQAFRGTLLDPFYYQVDIEDWGYEDRRKTEPLVDKNGEIL
jgi:hypothetical protein